MHFWITAFPLITVSAYPAARAMWLPMWPDSGAGISGFLQTISIPRSISASGSLLATGNLFGLQYIYGELTNSGGKDPLDFAAIMKSPAEYEVVATNALTGEARYFGKEEMKQDDYRPIMASSAIPAACRPVVIDGVPYYDGGIADAIPVRHALEKGAEVKSLFPL